MLKYIVLNKEVGQTPLQVVQEYKRQNPEFADIPMAYAGRLDPMASGKLLVLIGEECKQQEKYHALDKKYRFEVMFGSSSDTGDILGLIDWQKTPILETEQIKKVTNKLLGKVSLPYPSFSSRTVKGKPLHMWTLENRLHEIEIPNSETTIYDLKLIGMRTIPAEKLYQAVLDRINSIPRVTEKNKELGRDFRRDEVRLSWQNWLEYHKGKNIPIATFDCVASSGTYMRSLAEEIAKELGSSGLAYSIHRQIIGKYWKFGLWWKKFD